MESIVCLDASVLIDYFRKKTKKETLFVKLSLAYTGFVVPSVAHFESCRGSTLLQNQYWNNLFNDFLIILFTAKTSFTAIEISRNLKALRKTIQFKDLIIAASALHHNFSLATLNEKHFNNIKGWNLITPSFFQP